MMTAVAMPSFRSDEVDGDGGGGAKRLRKSSPAPAPEPTSVLDTRSPSPPTSSSLASSTSAPEPPPISAEDWEAVLSAGDMVAPPAASQDASFLRWIMDGEGYGDACFDLLKGTASAFDPFPPPQPCHEQPAADELFLLPPHDDDGLDPQAAVDDLLEAARRAEAGDPAGARGILTRLNHRLLPSPTAGRPPLLRAAAHLGDALLRLLDGAAGPTAAVSSPLDVALRLAAYKAMADASPAAHFAGLTATQAILDALAGTGARRVHVVDFDVRVGAHLPPLMQDLAAHQRHPAAQPPSLKVTALVSPGSAHPFELRLTRDALTRFAAELGVPFEFAAVEFDPLAPSPPINLPAAAPGEAVAVHLAIGSGSGSFSPTSSALRAVRHLRPAVVVCVDHGCHRGDLPLPRHVLNLARSGAAFLESLDAASPDAVTKIEQFILRPRAERQLLAGGGLPPWRAALASAGLSPVRLSDAAEAQVECLLRRTPASGFHVERRQEALALRWQQSELLAVSAWRCC